MSDVKRIAVVGGGISGLSIAQMLCDRYEVKVYEKEASPGGLIRCQRVNGSLFHICGGHVFNTKNEAVKQWFWARFNREKDFIKADRHSAVCLENGRFVDYPIENHVYQLDAEIQRQFYLDLDQMVKGPGVEPKNFDEFLRFRFGKTLYDLYFKPYNDKVWRRDLESIPLSWLQGKLPMPTPEEMREANEKRIEEKSFVHSSFYYEKVGGSQFIADTLAKGLELITNSEVLEIRKSKEKVEIRSLDGSSSFDAVVFTGNLKDLPSMFRQIHLGGFAESIDRLEYHGTTAAFCETDPIPYSWFYQPSRCHQSHRFICTGNFSPTNNAPGRMTCTVEFTDEIVEADIRRQLELMPYRPRFVKCHYSKYTYPIQHADTREMVAAFRRKLAAERIFLLGRFAEWEYYNMDAAIASALKLKNEISL